jgi:hypothetical protein
METDNFRGIPTFACICGSKAFNVVLSFDEETRLPGWYALDMSCFDCGRLYTAPTPVDKELK